MSLPFLSAFASVKVTAAAKGATAALVAFDPKGATEAQIVLMEHSLDELGKKIAGSQRQYNDAKVALATATTLNTQRLTAAESLQADPAKADSLNKLLEIIEKAQPDLERFRSEERDVGKYLADLRAAYDSAATKLKNARQQLEQAQRGMDQAKLAEERARDKADAASIAAGIHSGGDTLNVALDAMNRKTTAALDAAAAMDLKANALAPDDSERSDANIAAALNSANPSPGTPQTAAERLAALKSKAALSVSAVFPIEYSYDEGTHSIVLPPGAPFDGAPVLIKLAVGWVEAYWCKGELVTTIDGDDYEGFCWVCADDTFQAELDDAKSWARLPE